VALKWFVERSEAHVLQARQLRDAYLSGQCTLRAPDFLLLEIANALTTAHRCKTDKVEQALDAVREVGIQLDTLSAHTLVQAVELASYLMVTVYDSYFLALAIQNHSKLVTADEKFLRKAGTHPNIIALRELRLTV
jgi:predicted nucleic acid-binding protein